MSADQTDEIKYNGYRFLTDAGNSRQYAMQFIDGRPGSGIKVFAAAGAEASLKPGETLFAFDEAIDVAFTSFEAKVSATMFQITTNAEGKPRGMKMMGCEYDVNFLQGESGINVVYELTPHSVEALEAYGFSAQMPKTFTATLDPSEKGIIAGPKGLSIAPEALRSLPFPPQHKDGAQLARASIEASTMDANSGRCVMFRETMTDILERQPGPVYVQKKPPENLIEVYRPLTFRRAASAGV